jgi:hypothetical protein
MLKWLSGIFSFILVLSLQAGAQNKDPEPVKWAFSAKEISENMYEITMTATIDPGWHMYATHKYDTSHVSPTSTEFKFKKSPLYKLAGKTVEKTKPTKFQDPGFEIEVYYFENTAVFTQKVKATKPDVTVSGSVEFQLCKDFCIMKKKKFSIPPQKGNGHTKGIVGLYHERLLNPKKIC